MNRRDALRLGGTGALLLVAGCSTDAREGSRDYGPSAPEESERPEPADVPYRIGEYDYGDDGSGGFVATVTVENVGDDAPAATLVATVRTDEGNETAFAELDVPPGESRSYELAFETTADAFDESGSLRFEIE